MRYTQTTTVSTIIDDIMRANNRIRENSCDDTDPLKTLRILVTPNMHRKIAKKHINWYSECCSDDVYCGMLAGVQMIEMPKYSLLTPVIVSVGA